MLLRPGDRALTVWAEGAGGSLALKPHNIHVAEEGRQEGREQYSTRRRDRVQQLEAASYRERRAQAVSMRQGRNIPRHGFGMMDIN